MIEKIAAFASLWLVVLLTFTSLYGVDVAPDGKWSEFGVSARWLIAAPGWTRFVDTSARNFKRINSTEGELTENGKRITFRSSQETEQQDRMLINSSVSSSDFPEIEMVAYELSFPLGQFRKLTVDGKKLEIPREFEKMSLDYFPEKALKIAIEMRDGTLELEGTFSLLIQDNRKWSDSIVLRLKGRKGKKSGTYDIAFKLTSLARRSETISLIESVNMGFSDDSGGDGVGGWTDQGPSNDMRLLKTGKLSFSGIDFNVINPSENNGKSCIVLSSAQKKYPASAQLQVSGSKELPYFYLLHAAAWVPPAGTKIGSVGVTYSDDTTEDFPVVSGRDCGNWWIDRSFKNAGIAWDATNFEHRIGLYASVFPLSKVPKTIAFQVEGNAVWMICAASFSNQGAEFDSKELKVVIKSGKEWMPVKFSRHTEPGSALDFSAALEAPAGKYGRIVANEKGHLVFEKKPEKRIRFLGVNLCETANYFNRKEAEEFAAELARAGYNSVRFHHFENLLMDKKASDPLAFDPEMLDHLQYLMSCLKKRGIYYTFDLYASRKLYPGDSGDKTKLLFNIDPAALENWKAFAHRLLTVKNPYTNLSLAEDPALYVINLVNESNLSYYLPMNTDSVLAKKIQNRWETYRSSSGETAEFSGKGSGLYRCFLNELERARIREQTNFLRNTVKTKVLLTDLNFISDYPLNGVRSELQVVDMHAYWDHMRLLVPKQWGPPLRFSQFSALGQSAGHVRIPMQSRIFGRPYILTEVNYCYPNRYRTEYGSMFGAYAALQDWDGIYRFAWSHGKEWMTNETIGGFDIVKDPSAQLADRLIHALFVRGDVSAAPGGYGIDFQERNLAKLSSGKLSELQSSSKEFSFLGLFSRIGVLSGTQNAGNVRKFDLTASWKDSLAEREKKLLIDALNQERIVSETGEIMLTPQKKALVVTTPRSEALSGSGSLKGNVLHADNLLSPQTVALISLDGKKLVESRKLLLLHLVNMANSNQTFRNQEQTILEKYGNAPLLLERAKVDLALHLPQTMKIETLDFSGRITGGVKTVYRDGILRFRADTALRPHGVMAYLLTR